MAKQLLDVFVGFSLELVGKLRLLDQLLGPLQHVTHVVHGAIGFVLFAFAEALAHGSAQGLQLGDRLGQGLGVVFVGVFLVTMSVIVAFVRVVMTVVDDVGRLLFGTAQAEGAGQGGESQ